MNEEHHLSNKVFAALRWLAAGKFVGQFINWGITLYVIRLLAPADYGLMAMAMLFITLLTLLNELGLGAAIVQSRQIEPGVLQQIFAIVLLINTGLFFLLFAASPLIALFFHERQLVPMIRILSIQFIFMAFTVIPQSLLERDLKFKQRSVVELLANLAGGFTTLGLAMSGKGVWALVAGAVSTNVARTVGLNAIVQLNYRPVFSFRGMKETISFGGRIMLERILWQLYSRADVFIIGKMLGKELLGVYNVATDLAALPSEKIFPIISQVIFPAFSRIQDKPAQVAYYTLKGIRLLCFFAFPVFWGISSVAAEVIAVILGDKWRFAVVPLTWISLVLPLGMISGILLSVLKSLGRADVSLKNMLVAVVLMPGAFLMGCHWGILGISLAWVIAFPIYFLATLWRSLPHIGLRMLDLFNVMGKSVFASIIMYLVVAIIKYYGKGHVAPILELALLVSAGGSAYAGVQLWINREDVQEFTRFGRNMFTESH